MSESSFSDNVKYEICKAGYNKGSFLWFASGLLASSSDGEGFPGRIKVCGKVAGRLSNLLAEYGISSSVKDGRLYIGKIPSAISDKTRLFLEGDMPERSEIQGHVNSRAFLGGVCVGAGHISDPANSYKVEIHLKSESFGKVVFAVLAFEGIDPGITQRGNICCIRFKNGDYVSDFLGMCGADSARLSFENIRIEHELRKQITREVNCDDGNTRRQAEAGAERYELFNKLLASEKAKDLPEELLCAARASIENPGASIAELGNMMTPPISKSGMNNRLQKLMRIAQDL